jgi:hypothetical protein
LFSSGLVEVILSNLFDAAEEFLQLTATELQSSLNLECSFHAATVRTVAAISSPLAPLLLPRSAWREGLS